MNANTPQGTLEHLDPATLELETNVRDDAALAPEFVASIKEHGVLTPIAAVRGSDGIVRVRAGQRRTLAAREAGLATVPVYIRTATEGSDKLQAIERVAEQIIENDQRHALTESQRARGIQQLLINGLTPTKAAKALSVAKKTVEAAAVLSESETALAALDGQNLTIEQAAVLAEFDGNEQATQYLTAATSAGDFDHRVAELRHKAQAAAALAEAAQEYIKAGHTILENRPNWNDPLHRNNRDLLYAADGSGRISDDAVAANPAAWAVFLEEMPSYTDTRGGGETVDEDAIDWDIDPEDLDATPEEGLIHPRYIDETVAFEPCYYCLDLDAANAITSSEHYRRKDSGVPAGENPHTAAQRKEAERRERRKVVVLNKLGLAAAEVRCAWIKDKLLARKTPAKGVAIWLATQLAAHPHLITNYRAADTARELLGLPSTAQLNKVLADLPPTGDNRAIVILLGLVLGAFETETPKDAWRRKADSFAKAYLKFLATQGYELSDVEKVIIGKLDADKLYDQHAADAAAAKSAAATSAVA